MPLHHGLDPRRDRLPDGHVLHNRYRVLEVLAIGDSGAVYKAQDLRFAQAVRLCAIKEVDNSTDDPQTRASIHRDLEREISVVAALSHPGIVQIYDYFAEGKRSYIVLEYVVGHDLRTVLTDRDRLLPETKVVGWALEICEVLTYLHGHRPRPRILGNLSPSNLMLDDHGRIRLVDLGITRIFRGSAEPSVIGNPGYAPPEQHRDPVDARVDIYALSAIMHHLLSGRDPCGEEPFCSERCPLHEADPGISPELDAIIRRALEYDPDDRYASAKEMRDALANLSLRERSGTATTRVGTSRGGLPEPTPLWRFAADDEVRSSPAFEDGTVYVGSYDANLYALAASTGECLWRYRTDGGIASSPCVYEDTVFVGSADRVLYAVDKTRGRVRWTCPTRGRVWSSPRAAFGHVFFGSDDRHVYAVKVRGGRVAWKYEADGEVRSSPAIGEDAIYVGCEAGTVHAIDMGGNTVWAFRARRGVTSSPAFTEERIYVGSQDRYVYAVDVRSGWLVWRYRTDGPVISSPAISGDLVFVGSADAHLYALDTETGRLVWTYAADGQVTSSPVLLRETVYFGSVDGRVLAVDARSGELQWSFRTGGPVTSSPAVDDNAIFIGSCDGYVYALPP